MEHIELHKILADQGIRVFAFTLSLDPLFLIHPNKTVEEWRSDTRKIIAEIGALQDENGNVEDKIYNTLLSKFNDAGYFEIVDIVADVFEGRIAAYSAGIEDDPSHEDQADGFGHFGWESE